MHRRCRLGHRPQLHRLRPAGQRRDFADVRGRAELPGHLALLAGGGQTPGEHLLHRAHGLACPDARRLRPTAEHVTQKPAPARQRGRADQPGSLGVVLRGSRPEALPDRRHLVADRDRRHHAHAPAWHFKAQARLRHPAHVRRAAGAAGRARQTHRRPRRRPAGDQGQLAGADPQRLWRPPAHGRHLLQAHARLLLHWRRCPPRCRWRLLDHRAHR
ncbi:hypothetical protein D3C79_823390 [compost metagenome]